MMMLNRIKYFEEMDCELFLTAFLFKNDLHKR